MYLTIKMTHFYTLGIFLTVTLCGVHTATETNVTCPTQNVYLDSNEGCAAFIECRDYKAFKTYCPDGLNYNNNSVWPQYPCSYPNEVPCTNRTETPLTHANADCPRQYGYFKHPNADANDCGKYRRCVDGKAFDMYCAFGLAFNPETSRCDWPERVPSCKVNDFLGFKCPPGEEDESGNPIISNHSYGNDCYYFFSCQGGNARVLSCDSGYAFNALTGHCENAEHVDCKPITITASIK